ncbi:hypothetical protein [Nocardia macrotermitis]|uniref:Uncharacterized protein n=1 Tax=Nocardia macrotermitis TaxID=2585198 RepID=A0A7K0DBQ7_9NOCA|nr:hypothetical protein [Nocardia macrotermitis]MQY22732.1 hypothetical protein [Nocardia macrotermitis]
MDGIITGMSNRQPLSELSAALLDLCRKDGMKLSIEVLVMDSGDEVMIALTGTAPPADLTDRGRLACWILAMVMRRTAAFGDGTRDAGIALAALPTDTTLHDMNVGERVKHLGRSHGFSKHDYGAHRNRVVNEIATCVELEYPNYCARQSMRRHDAIPTIFFAGYDVNETMDQVAEAVGIEVDRLPFPATVCSMASRVAMIAGYTFAAQADMGGLSADERYTLYRRQGSSRNQPINRYRGLTANLLGSLTEARITIIERSDLVIVLGGDAGTDSETQFADRLGKPVVSLPATGGAARRYYDNFTGRIPTAIAADYRDLAHRDPDISVPAVGRVVTHLLADQFG